MFNLLKIYNQLLELSSLSPTERLESLKRVFKRDIENNPHFCFRKKNIYPTSKEGQDSMEILFHHLTNKTVDEKTKKREYDAIRSERLHWIKYHIEELKKDEMLVFSVLDVKKGVRTYIYDKIEKYVVILEPYRNKEDSYYLLTAYKLEGKGGMNNIEKKYNRRLSEIY